MEEAATTFSRLFPLGLAGRHALNLIQPVGEQQDEQVRHLWQQAGQARTLKPAEPTNEAEEPIERFYIEMDGVKARLQCGSVPMEKKEL